MEEYTKSKHTFSFNMGHTVWKESIEERPEQIIGIKCCCPKIAKADLRKIGRKNEGMMFQRT